MARPGLLPDYAGMDPAELEQLKSLLAGLRLFELPAATEQRAVEAFRMPYRAAEGESPGQPRQCAAL